jgi:hypothetical protein
MAICSVANNPPHPSGIRILSNDELTPEIQRYAASFAYSNDPIGSIHKKWFSNPKYGQIPIVILVECHGATVKPDGTVIPGAYHGATAFRATDPSMYPEALTAPEGGPTDWGVVALTSAAAVGVVAAFWWALKAADRRPRRRS